MRDYRKLRAYELAHELVLEVYRLTRRYPKAELFGLTKQIRTAAVSVPANIVEGAAGDSQADFLRFLHIAFASLQEVGYYLRLSHELEYLSQREAAHARKQKEETSKVLSGLIKALQNSRE